MYRIGWIEDATDRIGTARGRMNANPHLKNQGASGGNERSPVLGWIRFSSGVALVAVLTGVFVHFTPGSRPAVHPGSENKAQKPTVRGQESEGRRPKRETIEQKANAGKRDDLKPAPSSVASTTLPEPTPQGRQLVSSLSQLDQVRRPMTHEETATWKHNWEQLVQQGAVAVPAIVEFLKQNKDVDFDPGASEMLRYSSVRKAMFDALVQIGGSEAVTGTLQILQTTADPREIALLAQNLEKLAPEVYRQEAIRAAREALAMATESKLEGTDVAPLFEVLHKFGDASVVSDLEKDSKQWNYYSTMALAQLPDGTGIPALIQIARSGAGASGNALEMLTQVSLEYPEAHMALLDMARADKIPQNLWPYLIPLLAGDRYHYQDTPFETLPNGKRNVANSAYVVFGNQHFYTAPDVSQLTAEEIDQRMALIDELQAVSAEPAVLQALQRARDLLRRRAPPSVAVSP